MGSIPECRVAEGHQMSGMPSENGRDTRGCDVQTATYLLEMARDLLRPTHPALASLIAYALMELPELRRPAQTGAMRRSAYCSSLGRAADQGTGRRAGRSIATAYEEIEPQMAGDIHYEVVEHDGGWAYKVGDVFSETFRTHDDASAAARDASARQELAGETEGIVYQDEKGEWHEEIADGGDRPHADVIDTDR